jgi:hypothetical protein
MAKSLLYQDDAPMQVPPGCGLCDRVEVPISFRKNGRIYRFVLRDKLVVEDVVVMMMKATAFAISQGEPYAGTPPPRSIKDFLIKQDTVV